MSNLELDYLPTGKTTAFSRMQNEMKRWNLKYLEMFSTKEYVSYSKDISFAYNEWQSLALFSVYFSIHHLGNTRLISIHLFISFRPGKLIWYIYNIIKEMNISLKNYQNRIMPKFILKFTYVSKLIFWIFIAEIWIFETLSFSCWMWFVMARKLLIDMIELRRTHMQKYLKLFRIWEGIHWTENLSKRRLITFQRFYSGSFPYDLCILFSSHKLLF